MDSSPLFSFLHFFFPQGCFPSFFLSPIPIYSFLLLLISTPLISLFFSSFVPCFSFLLLSLVFLFFFSFALFLPIELLPNRWSDFHETFRDLLGHLIACPPKLVFRSSGYGCGFVNRCGLVCGTLLSQTLGIFIKSLIFV